MNVLVTGGAGYIGSHAVKQLIEAEHHVVVVDNLSRGHREAVHEAALFHHVDIADSEQLVHLMVEHDVDCVMHFAAYALVGESVDEPLSYYTNNTCGTLNLLHAMKAASVHKLVFSSTCATYGEPAKIPISESTPQKPINPYGRSKLFVEQILRDYSAAEPSFGFIALRYFNVAGCSADGTLGENHDLETHLIPIVLQAALGQRERVTIFGEDYPTPDGTCLRDYIHVCDLCRAHIMAMEALCPGMNEFYNVGIGQAWSVREIIESARRVTNLNIPTEIGQRRAGDPAVLLADPSKINDDLGWKPEYTEVEATIETAWRWFREHPCGNASRTVQVVD